MKLATRSIGVVALICVLVGLALHFSAASLNATQAASRDALASGFINLGGKLSIVAALILAYLGVQRAQWRWVGALVVGAALTLFSGPLSGLTNTGAAPYIVFPVLAAILAIIYTFRMGDRAAARV